MSKTAIISVDGHVRASRSDYRNYVEKQYLDVFDEWVRAEEAAGAPESGNLSPSLDPTSQWDSDLRLKDMESQGVVAEVLFPNGLPFQSRPADDVGTFSAPASTVKRGWPTTAGSPTSACRPRAVEPARHSSHSTMSNWRSGDIRWAKEHGLGGGRRRHCSQGGRSSSIPRSTRCGPPASRSTSRSASTAVQGRPPTGLRGSPPS